MSSSRLSGDLRRVWAKWGPTATVAAVAVMLPVSAIFLGYETWRLVFDSSELGAFDLGLRHQVVNQFFSGIPVYAEVDFAVYPPATQVLLWPFLGWLSFPLARWLWAATGIACLAWLTRMILRELKPEGLWPRCFIAMLPLALYATGATIGNGQLPLHVLATLTAGCLLLVRRDASWARDLLAAGLVLFALAKPTVSALFFWIVLFVPSSLRPAALCASGYVLLTLFASWFQDRNVVALLGDWLNAAAWGIQHGAERGDGYSTIVDFLAALGRNARGAEASVGFLVLLGAWVWWRREGDIWTLLGVSALVARFWAYHRWYDDLLILLPLVAVLRVAQREFATTGWGVASGLVFAFSLATMIVPGGKYLFPALGLKELEGVFLLAQFAGWCALLVVLLLSREPTSPSSRKFV